MGINEVFLAAVDNNGKSYHWDKILPLFERENALDIKPTFYPEISIKVETHFAPGICTSKNLVRELVVWLRSKGYSRDKITIFDHERQGLVAAGFLTEDPNDHFFEGVRVFDSSAKEYFQSDWFHESPLPPTSFDRAKFVLKFPGNLFLRTQEERKSYLPAKVLGDAFWINLAVPMDDPFLGIDGASANMTLGAMSNYGRFSNKTTLSAATVAEVLAIPGIGKETFSILTFQLFRLRTGSGTLSMANQNAIFIGRTNCVGLLRLEIINKERKLKHGLQERFIDDSLLFKYAKELGLGDTAKFNAKRIR